MMEPPRQPGSPAVPMNMPSMTQPPSVSIPSGPPPVARQTPAPPPTVMTKETPEEARPTVASSPRESVDEEAKEPSKETAELSEKEKLDEFKKTFPDFGKDEFQLANDDLYPDWKKRVSPDGNLVGIPRRVRTVRPVVDRPGVASGTRFQALEGIYLQINQALGQNHQVLRRRLWAVVAESTAQRSEFRRHDFGSGFSQ